MSRKSRTVRPAEGNRASKRPPTLRSLPLVLALLAASALLLVAVGAWVARRALGEVARPVDDEVTLTAFSSGAAFEFRRTGRRRSSDLGGDR